MTNRRQIIITKEDHQLLESLLSSEFAAAFNDKPYLQSLRGELDIAKIVDPQEVPDNTVTMNSTVRLRQLRTKEIETYTLVYPQNANISEGRLSVLAPIGTAILGYRVGDRVEWHVPSGQIRFKIEELVHQPEREDGMAIEKPVTGKMARCAPNGVQSRRSREKSCAGTPCRKANHKHKTA